MSLKKPSSSRPSKEELKCAWGTTLPDVIGLDCKILFCGINPGLYTAATGFHFARPGNRFWPALNLAGLTPGLLEPHQQAVLPDLGMGITNLVSKATRTAQELTSLQITEGLARLRSLVAYHNPKWLAVLGITVFKQALGRKNLAEGPLTESWGTTKIWLLPNPSGLNAHLKLAEFARSLNSLAIFAGLPIRPYVQ